MGPVAGGADEPSLVRPPHPPQAEVPAQHSNGGPAPSGQGQLRVGAGPLQGGDLERNGKGEKMWENGAKEIIGTFEGGFFLPQIDARFAAL